MTTIEHKRETLNERQKELDHESSLLMLIDSLGPELKSKQIQEAVRVERIKLELCLKKIELERVRLHYEEELALMECTIKSEFKDLHEMESHIPFYVREELEQLKATVEKDQINAYEGRQDFAGRQFEERQDFAGRQFEERQFEERQFAEHQDFEERQFAGHQFAGHQFAGRQFEERQFEELGRQFLAENGLNQRNISQAPQRPSYLKKSFSFFSK